MTADEFYELAQPSRRILRMTHCSDTAICSAVFNSEEIRKFLGRIRTSTIRIDEFKLENSCFDINLNSNPRYFQFLIYFDTNFVYFLFEKKKKENCSCLRPSRYREKISLAKLSYTQIFLFFLFLSRLF